MARFVLRGRLHISPYVACCYAIFFKVLNSRSRGAFYFRRRRAWATPATRLSGNGEEVFSILKEAGLPVFETVIRRYKAFQKAALDGLLVKDVSDPYASEAWRDCKAIAIEVLR